MVLRWILTKRAIEILTIMSIFLLFATFGLPSTFSQDNPAATEETPITSTEPPTEIPSPLPSDTPIPSATFTELPVETPTELPTLTETATLTITEEVVTLEPSASPTIESPTSEVTVEVTSEVTPSSTPTLDLTPTEIPLGTELPMLSFDQFDTPNFANWLSNIGNSLVPSDTGKALHISGANNLIPLSQGSIADVVIEARVFINEGTANFGVRHSGLGGYVVALNAMSEVALYRGETLLSQASSNPVASKQWHTLRFAAVGNVISVVVDGVELIVALEENPLPLGTVFISGDPSLTSDFLVDDFSVRGSINETPIAIPIAEPQDEAQGKSIDAKLMPAAQIGGTRGSRIVYASNQGNSDGNTDIWIIDDSGGNAARLTSGAAFDLEPTLSGNGLIAFVSDSSGNFDLYTMNMNGGSITVRRPTLGIGETQPAWSPNSGEIVYSRNGEIIVFTLSSGGERNLTPPQPQPQPHSSAPSWSPNGLKIAFISDRTDDPVFQNDIYLMDASDGANLQRLTTTGAGALDWSPSGNELVYIDTFRDGISVITSSGAFARQLTSDAADSHPSWSTSGTQITLERQGDIMVMPSSGGITRGLTHTINSIERSPDWGPICPATQVAASNRELRIQPFIYDRNYVFILNSGTLPVTATSIQISRPWLWQHSVNPVPSPLPTTITINSVEAVGFAGVINWVHSSAQWIQVRIQAVNGETTYTFTGYMRSGALTFRSPCNTTALPLSDLPFPTPDPGLPKVTPVTFNVSPRSPVFANQANANVPPAVMGSFGLHEGTNPSVFGTTIDIIPRNIELCIDSHPLNDLGVCNPTTSSTARIPVFAPYGGCAVFSNAIKTLEINIDRVNAQGQPSCADWLKMEIAL